MVVPKFSITEHPFYYRFLPLALQRRHLLSTSEARPQLLCLVGLSGPHLCYLTLHLLGALVVSGRDWSFGLLQSVPLQLSCLYVLPSHPPAVEATSYQT